MDKVGYLEISVRICYGFSNQGKFEGIDSRCHKIVFPQKNDDWFFHRWGHIPIDEAQTFGHTQVVEYMKKYEDELERAKTDGEEGSGEERTVKTTQTTSEGLPL